MSNIKNMGAVVRCLDDMGRVVIPKAFRKKLGIESDTPLAISLSGEEIILTRQKDSCVFCGSQDDLGRFGGRMVCAKCREDLRAMSTKGDENT